MIFLATNNESANNLKIREREMGEREREKERNVNND